MSKRQARANGAKAEAARLDELELEQRRVAAEQDHAERSRAAMHQQFDDIQGHLREGERRMNTMEGSMRDLWRRQEAFEKKVETDLIGPLRPVTEVFADIGHVYPVLKRWGRRGTRVVVWAGSIAGATWAMYKAALVFGLL